MGRIQKLYGLSCYLLAIIIYKVIKFEEKNIIFNEKYLLRNI